MPTAIHIKSDLLRPLSALALIQQPNGGYYRELRHSKDPYIAVAAWCALFDNKLMVRAYYDEVLPYCRYAAVRSRAFPFFLAARERDYSRQVANTDVAPESEAYQRAMLAQLSSDHAASAEASGDLFLATGDFNHLNRASEEAELAGGWRAALVWTVRAVVASPLSATGVGRLYGILDSSAQPELLEEAAQVFAARNMYLQINQVFLAAAAMLRDKPELVLEKLKPFTDEKIAATGALKPYLGTIRAHRAQANEKLGNYRKAYEDYLGLNAAEKDPKIDPENYHRGLTARAKLVIPALPPVPHPDVAQMLGFPRSGTTLLENTLAAHSMIETFEEVPALTGAIDRIEQVLMKTLPPEPPEATYLAARARYYGEIESLRKKPDATVLVDKMPIRSADVALISKLFPEWRYIFSIRHPFDVVLSCFKQRFQPNPAMENFRTIESTARLYDQVMTVWFEHHTMDDPSVHYVKYDELVTDFERVARGTLEFLGVPWDDAVRDFSKSAENRAARTPSYQKVRQGLSIGVQSSWRNYGFLFQSDATKPLHKWAEFFGYPTE